MENDVQRWEERNKVTFEWVENVVGRRSMVDGQCERRGEGKSEAISTISVGDVLIMIWQRIKSACDLVLVVPLTTTTELNV